MKQNTEDPDYRSINEVQLKYELIKLEKKILDITGDPIDYKHYSPFLDWCRDDAKVEAVEEMMLNRSYILNLLFEIHCTPAEVARLKKINGMLLEMTNRTYHRTADMMRALMVIKRMIWTMTLSWRASSLRGSTSRIRCCVWRRMTITAPTSSVWRPSFRKRRRTSPFWQM